MGIGKTLSELIKFKNTNVNELARNAKVSPQTIYAIIKRDNKKADIEVLLKISKVLGVNVDYFFNNDITSVENNLQDESVFNNTNITDNIYNKPTKRKSLDELIEEEDSKHYATIAGYGGGVKTIDLDEKKEFYSLIKNDNTGYDKTDMTKDEYIKMKDMLDIIRK